MTVLLWLFEIGVGSFVLSLFLVDESCRLTWQLYRRLALRKGFSEEEACEYASYAESASGLLTCECGHLTMYHFDGYGRCVSLDCVCQHFVRKKEKSATSLIGSMLLDLAWHQKREFGRIERRLDQLEDLMAEKLKSVEAPVKQEKRVTMPELERALEVELSLLLKMKPADRGFVVVEDKATKRFVQFYTMNEDPQQLFMSVPNQYVTGQGTALSGFNFERRELPDTEFIWEYFREVGGAAEGASLAYMILRTVLLVLDDSGGPTILIQRQSTEAN